MSEKNTVGVTYLNISDVQLSLTALFDGFSEKINPDVVCSASGELTVDGNSDMHYLIDFGHRITVKLDTLCDDEPIVSVKSEAFMKNVPLIHDVWINRHITANGKVTRMALCENPAEQRLITFIVKTLLDLKLFNICDHRVLNQ